MNSVSGGLVTVVIANYNRCSDLRVALKSVQTQDYPSVEVIVVDNASTDGSCQMIAEEFPDTMVIRLKKNLGMDGYSVGFRQARGEFIFQMDNDSIMPEVSILTEVIERFCRGPSNLGVVATRVEEYNSNKDAVEIPQSHDWSRGPIKTGGFHAGGAGFRRAFLTQVGFYNSDVFLYGSELFLQMKFLAAGFQILYFPEIIMLHKSSPVARSPQSLYYMIRNNYWFLRCFATPIQQVFLLPRMFLHDAVYVLLEKSPKTLLLALRDGLGKLPDSLTPPLRSTEADFVAKVKEFCNQYTMAALLAKIRTRSIRLLGS
jgi:hypothetical protein